MDKVAFKPPNGGIGKSIFGALENGQKVIVINFNFIIPISLQHNVVDLRYFKL